MAEVFVGVAIIVVGAAVVLCVWLYITITARPGPLYGKPFRVCPTCGETYDDPMDLFHGHIMKMGPDELMTCPKCEGHL